MSIPDILLAVCVLILVWRVWRLEDGKREVYDTMRQMLKINDIGRAGEIDVLRAENRLHEVLNKDRARVHSLARALGYEWKRTDAKEGWERKNPFISDYVRKLDTDINDIVSGRTIYTDRRKADRRKPGFPEVDESVSWDLGTGKKTFTRTKKKPRRAH